MDCAGNACTDPARRRVVALAAGTAAGGWLAGCASAPALSPVQTFRAVDRLTWGATGAALREVAAHAGYAAYVEAQLDPRRPETLPPAVEQRIAALTVSTLPLQRLVDATDALRRDADALPTQDERAAARQAWQRELTRLAREAASRHLLRAVHSDRQLHAHLTWFWLNHFNVHRGKANLRAMVGDYEEQAIRPHALGRFRDLLGATARHPALLRYLDNERNAVRRGNENHARELLELHTLGEGGGYAQRDVQELARVLTGWGVSFRDADARRGRDEARHVRDGNFEFDPGRHDFGDKTFLGRTIRGRGAAEVEEALDLLAAHPSTARFVCTRMAQYLLADEPPAPLVAAMSRAFAGGDGGDVTAALRVLLLAPAFASPKPRKFKDPVHYAVSALRAARADDAAAALLDTSALQNWLDRAGEGLYDRQTPDGYPLVAAAWTGSGQMAARFDFARAVAAGPLPGAWPDGDARPLAPGTRAALAQAATRRERVALFLSSPDFMLR